MPTACGARVLQVKAVRVVAAMLKTQGFGPGLVIVGFALQALYREQTRSPKRPAGTHFMGSGWIFCGVESNGTRQKIQRNCREEEEGAAKRMTSHVRRDFQLFFIQLPACRSQFRQERKYIYKKVLKRPGVGFADDR